MVANVFVIIIPYQKKTVAAMIAGKEPDPRWGELGKQRSVHNNYLTLPVVFLMLSNHYPLFFATRFNWVIVAIVLADRPGDPALLQFAPRGQGQSVVDLGRRRGRHDRRSPGCRPPDRGPPRPGALPPTPKFADVSNIVMSRCSMCHAAEPVWDGIAAAPKGVLLDTDEQIRLHAPLIEIVAVRSNFMPPGNITEMTGDERLVLASWLAAGRAGTVTDRRDGEVERACHSRPAADASCARRAARATLRVIAISTTASSSQRTDASRRSGRRTKSRRACRRTQPSSITPAR